MKKHISIIVSLCLVVIMAAASWAAFTPGTYEGEGKGYSETSPVKVKVTVDAEKITKVEIDAPEEVPFGVQNFDNYAGQLIGKSEAKIDAVSNATLTRNGIAEAVTKALKKAAPAASGFKPGTYEGEGKGYSEGAPVKVKVTVDAEKITAVEIDAPEEVPFGVQNFETYKNALIGRTDGNIDAVSNATMTRNGIREAVEKALAAAKGQESGSSATCRSRQANTPLKAWATTLLCP